MGQTTTVDITRDECIHRINDLRVGQQKLARHSHKVSQLAAQLELKRQDLYDLGCNTLAPGPAAPVGPTTCSGSLGHTCPPGHVCQIDSAPGAVGACVVENSCNPSLQPGVPGRDCKAGQVCHQVGSPLIGQAGTCVDTCGGGSTGVAVACPSGLVCHVPATPGAVGLCLPASRPAAPPAKQKVAAKKALQLQLIKAAAQKQAAAAAAAAAQKQAAAPAAQQAVGYY